MKRGLIVGIVLLALVVIAGVGLRVYLQSRWAAQRVVAVLASKLGPTVQLEEASVGIGSSTSLHGLKLLETGEHAQPWLVVDNLEADVGAIDFLRGAATPSRVTLHGATITLRWDKEGHFVSGLPEPPATNEPTTQTLPTVHLNDVRLILRREGREDMLIKNIEGQLVDKEGVMILTGKAADPYWGDWKVAGAVDLAKKTVSLDLKEGKVHVTGEVLGKIPFLLAGIEKQLQPEGDIGNGDMHFAFDLATGKFDYRIQLEPQKAVVKLPTVDLQASEVTGKVILHDSEVELKDLAGRAFDGKFQAAALLDYTSSEWTLKVSPIRAEKMDVSRLPASWNFPTQIEGRLSGKANVEAVFTSIGPKLTGTGRGQIDDAKLAGFAAEPITIELHASRTGLQWKPTEKSTREGMGGHPLLAAMQPFLVRALVQEKSESELPKLLAGGAIAIVEQIERGTNLFLQGGGEAVQKFGLDSSPEAKAKPKAARALEINLAMKKIELAEFAKKLNVNLPFPIEGKLTFRVKASIPIDTPTDPKTYRARGEAQIERLRIADLHFDTVQADVNYENGVLVLERFDARLLDEAGTLTGLAKMPLFPPGDLTAEVRLQSLSLGSLSRMVPEAKSLRGLLSGRVDFRAPVARLAEPISWHADGEFSSDRLYGFDVTLRKTSAKLKLDFGILSLVDLKTYLADQPLSGTGQVLLTGRYPFKGTVGLRELDLAHLKQIVSDIDLVDAVQGRLSVEGSVAGTLMPFTAKTFGKIEAADLTVYGIDLRKASANWSGDAKQITLKDIAVGLEETGAIKGQVVVPLDPKLPGSMDLRFVDFTLDRLTRNVRKLPVRVEGKLSGSLKGTIAPAEPNRERAVSVNLDVHAPQLRVQGIPAQQLQGKIDFRNGQLDYALEGKTLGGTFELNGKMPAKDSVEEGKGALRIRSLHLGRLWQALKRSREGSPLRGVVSVEIDFVHKGLEQIPTGSGHITLENLEWHGTPLARRIQGELTLAHDELRLRRIEGNLGTGRFSGYFVYDVHTPSRSSFALNLENIDTAPLLAAYDIPAEGRMSARIRGRLGAEWFGSADVTLPRGTIAGIAYSDIRLPITWSISPTQGSGRLTLPELAGHVALGRISGNLNASWGYSATLDGKLLFNDVDLPHLIRSADQTAQLGLGKISGRFDFAGSDVRSLNDIRGLLQATFGQSQGLSFPVFRQLAPFVGASPSTSFQKGELRARLANGVARLERFSLESQNLQVFAQGNVSLQGRLDLTATVMTGSLGPNLPLLRFVGLRIPLAGPTPIGVLMRASELLSNRVIHVTITGTYRNPVVRVEPLRLLSDEAVRFFLQQSGLPVTSAIPGSFP